MRLDWLQKYNLLIFDQVDSTNTEALSLAKSGAAGNFVIIAETQTGGRGQRGKLWHSISGNLHISLLLEIDFDTEKQTQLSFVTANAVYEAIISLVEDKKRFPDVQLKWPNDVLIDGKKVAGILLESISVADKKYVVIGIGANVLEYPKELDRPVTSLREQGIELAHPDMFMNMFMNKFDKLFSGWQKDNNFAKTRKNWLGRAFNLNKVITINDGVKRISGIFRGIDLDGAIRLELSSGQICNLPSGEVIM